MIASTTPSSRRQPVLERLSEQLRCIETRDESLSVGSGTVDGHVSRAPQHVSTGWLSVDRALAGNPPHAMTLGAPGGLPRGVIHEWFYADQTPCARRSATGLSVLAHLATRALRHPLTGSVTGWAVWIGRRCWPGAWTLLRLDGAQGELLRHSIFVDPPDDATRLWAIDLSLRSSAVGAVVADGRGLQMAESRRAQLAAHAGRTLGLLMRPERERSELSAAASRWLIEPRDLGERGPGWSIELLRCKGVRPVEHDSPCWAVEWDYETGVVALSADVVDRPDSATSGLAPSAGQRQSA